YKLLEDTRSTDNPTHFVVIFDASGKTFRNDIYPEYKAHRPPAPEDLVPQFALIRDAVRAFGVPCIEMLGYEADDIIATYARAGKEAGARVTIVSSDKDLMQLVGPGIEMLDTMKNRLIHEAEVVEKFGLGPDKVIDIQSLAGDSSDNVPGVPGIGIKTAAQLITEYGDLDTHLERAGEIKQPKRRQNLIEFADQARISRQLVTLDQHVPVTEDWSEFVVNKADAGTLLGFLSEMEFTSLTRRVAEAMGAPVPAPNTGSAPAPAAASGSAAEIGNSPAAAVDFWAAKISQTPIDAETYETVRDTETLAKWIDAAVYQGFVSVDTETTSLDAMTADLVGVSLALEPGKACYLPLGHVAEGLGLDDPDLDQIDMKTALALLKPLLEDPGVLKIGQNLKYDALLLTQYRIELAPIDDTMLMSYALDSGLGGHGMDALSDRHLGHKPIPFKEVAGSGKSQITFDKVPIAAATKYAAEDADVTLRLWRVLAPRLAAESLKTVYETLERPLVPILVAMERAGIKVDRQVLSRVSGE
ncbi:MAG: 5'-3' exonuclease H3TH domain-containing protein, partial [Hyphomicrobiales bacterium]